MAVIFCYRGQSSALASGIVDPVAGNGCIRQHTYSTH